MVTIQTSVENLEVIILNAIATYTRVDASDSTLSAYIAESILNYYGETQNASLSESV
jgi:hypothetical protein